MHLVTSIIISIITKTMIIKLYDILLSRSQKYASGTSCLEKIVKAKQTGSDWAREKGTDLGFSEGIKNLANSSQFWLLLLNLTWQRLTHSNSTKYENSLIISISMSIDRRFCCIPHAWLKFHQICTTLHGFPKHVM